MLLALFDQASRGGSHGPRFIVPFLLLIVLLLLGGWLVRRRRSDDGDDSTPSSPLQTLQQRFVRGDIDRAEYEHRKAVLDGADFVPPAPESQPPMQPDPPPTSETDAPDVHDGEE